MTLFKSVNFGSDETGLTTVGFTLINSDGSINQSRSTSGVFEIKTNCGVYGSYIDFDTTGWTGVILWDTGSISPVYASEEFNYQIDDSTSFLIPEIISSIENSTVSEDLKKLLGLCHENIFIDLPSYDDNSNLISARVRIYSNSSDVGTNNSVLASYIIDSASSGPGKFTNWKQVKS
jgi:hypothetical protein